MMKLIKIAYIGVFVSVLLTGCTKEQTNIEEVKSIETNIEEVKPEEIKFNDPKVWKDISTPEGFDKYGIEPTLEAWIAYHAEDVAKTADVYEYYRNGDILTSEMRYFGIQGDDLQKDFDNLQLLNATIGALFNFVEMRDSQDPVRAIYTEELNTSFKYFTELLQDLNIVINYDGKGETFGITHQLDGNRLKEFESYIHGTEPY